MLFRSDLLDVFVSSFNSAIHLLPIRRRVMMLDFKLHTKLGDHSIIEVGNIICDNSLWDTISIDKVMLDEPIHEILGNIGK